MKITKKSKIYQKKKYILVIDPLCPASSEIRQGEGARLCPCLSYPYTSSYHQEKRIFLLCDGLQLLCQALSKKGVSQADAEKAVELVFKEEDSDVDQKSIIGLSKHSINHLYVQASKQWVRGHDVPEETRKSRIIRWLQYRGFDWDVINLMLKKLEKQDPP